MIMPASLLITQLIFICFMHWVADFVCQSRSLAENKHKDNSTLFLHTTIYAIIMLVGLIFYPIFQLLLNFVVYNTKTDFFIPMSSYIERLLGFSILTFVFHTITDYFTSRLNKMVYDKDNTGNFFKCIGFDQFLHYAQLFFTWYIVVLR